MQASKFVFFANTDWYLYNFRLPTALQLQYRGIEVVMLSPPGPFGERFAQHGIRWRQLPMDRAGLNPAHEALTVYRLSRLLASERPDLLHNFTVKCAVYGALAARRAQVPAVVNAVAGLGYVFTGSSAKARLLRPLVRALMRASLGGPRSRLILQNPDDAETLLASGIVEAPLVRLIRGSGVDTQRFRPPVRADADAPRPLRVVLAARLLRDKGVGEFVEAAAMLAAQGRRIEFLLAGTPDPGNPHSITHAQATAWHEQGHVKWLGHVEDMPALLASADVMALPSYYREGVPKCLLEGAAAGLALVTTCLPGCREVVTSDGVDGLHVAPRDAGSLAAALARLDDDRTLLRRLGARARQHALTEFDQDLVIQRTFDVYAELVGEMGTDPGTSATRHPGGLGADAHVAATGGA